MTNDFTPGHPFAAAHLEHRLERLAPDQQRIEPAEDLGEVDSGSLTIQSASPFGPAMYPSRLMATP